MLIYRNVKGVRVQRKVGNSCCTGYVKTYENTNEMCHKHHINLQNDMIVLNFDV